jgi:hypothetical protein
MFERFDKKGAGHRNLGTEKGWSSPHSTPAVEGFAPGRSDRTYPNNDGVTMLGTYKTVPKAYTPVEGGGKTAHETFPGRGTPGDRVPGTKAPFTLAAPRTEKPSAR